MGFLNHSWFHVFFNNQEFKLGICEELFFGRTDSGRFVISIFHFLQVIKKPTWIFKGSSPKFWGRLILQSHSINALLWMKAYFNNWTTALQITLIIHDEHLLRVLDGKLAFRAGKVHLAVMTRN